MAALRLGSEIILMAVLTRSSLKALYTRFEIMPPILWEGIVINWKKHEVTGLFRPADLRMTANLRGSNSRLWL